jgi:hypothetical protein
MIQVRPVEHTDPGIAPDPADDVVPTRDVQLWAAVDHPTSLDQISDVFWKIYEPKHGGAEGEYQFKVQVHGTRIGAGVNFQERIDQCASLGSSNQPGSMFEAAVHTGQLTADAVDNANFGLVAKCQQAEKAIYFAKFALDKDQACGMYKVELHAVSNGAEAIHTNYIDVLCFYYMNKDFNNVNWGTITPGSMQVLSGNVIYLDGDGHPTIHNGGNRGLGLSVHFFELTQVSDAAGNAVNGGGKIINKFDACFGRSASTIQCIGQPPDNPIPASVETAFDDTRDRVLCSDERGKLDLSIHPDSTLPGGTYQGRVEVIARAVPGICDRDRDFASIPQPPAQP